MPNRYWLIALFLSAAALGLFFVVGNGALRSFIVLFGFACFLIARPIWASDTNAYNRFTLATRVVLAILVALPFLCTVVFSLFKVDSINLHTFNWGWAGTENYRAILSNPTDLFGLWRTIQFTTVAVGLETLLGVLIGAALGQVGDRMLILRSLFILPVIMPPLIAGMLWRSLLDQSFGGLNRLLGWIGVEGLPWLSLTSLKFLDSYSVVVPYLRDLANLRLGMFSALITEVWQWTPFVALIIAAGIRMIPREHTEWARTQGASGFQLFWLVQLPHLKSLIGLVVVLRFIDCLKTYESIWVFFGNNTETATSAIRIATYAVEMRDFGHGAALALVYLALAVVTAGVMGFRLVNISARTK